MKEILAYMCSDGAVFSDERKAVAYEDDLIGAEIDGILKLFNLDISRHQEYKGCLSVMRKRKELLASAKAIIEILMSESISIKVVDDTTLVLTDDWLADYIRLTGDPERPWYFLHGQTLPLTQYV